MPLSPRLIPCLLVLNLLGACQRSAKEEKQPATPDTREELLPVFQKLGWLEGSWQGESEGNEVHERWQAPRGSQMHGYGYTVAKSNPADTLFSERLTLRAHRDSLSYEASIGGTVTPFRATQLTDSLLVFENPQHDFPQQITYRLKPDGSLQATVSGKINGQLQKEELLLRKVK